MCFILFSILEKSTIVRVEVGVHEVLKDFLKVIEKVRIFDLEFK